MRILRAARAISYAILLVAATASPSAAQGTAGADAASDPARTARPAGHVAKNRDVFLQPHPETQTLTRDWFGLGPKLRERGVTSTLNLWITYQGNVSGGLDTDHDVNGKYWFANHVDLERLVRLPGASAYVLVEGGWNEGVSDAVGALMDVNGIVVGDEAAGVSALWLDQTLMDERLRLRLGKLDVTLDNFEFHGRAVGFDAMPYANTPRTQFLDSGLVNNAAVPFPAAGLGGMLLVEPLERWYVAVAGFDRQSDKFTWSYANAFESWMVAVETGVVVPTWKEDLTGQYYVGYWYSTFPDSAAGQGAYLGVAQELYREPGTERQGLGLFARYGYANRSPGDIRHFWSLGFQYRGPVSGRDDDILAVGWAQAFTRRPEFSAPSEGVLELYYRARLTPWLHLSPHAQFIANPGSTDADDAWTLGVRAQVTF